MDGPGRRLRLHLESHLRKVTNANFNLSGCERKPDAKRKRGGAQPQERAQPSIKKEELCLNLFPNINSGPQW